MGEESTRKREPTVTAPANNWIKSRFGISEDSTKNGYFGNAAAGIIDAIIPRTQRDFAGLIAGGAQPGGLGAVRVGGSQLAGAAAKAEQGGIFSSLASKISGLFKSAAPAAEERLIGKPSINNEFGSSGKVSASPGEVPFKPTGNPNIDSAVEAATQRVNAAREALKTAKGLELDAANQEFITAQRRLTDAKVQAKNYADLTKQENLLYELDTLREEKANIQEQTSTPARDAQLAKIDKRIDDITRTTPDKEGKLGELATIEKRINERNPIIRGNPGSTPEAINEVLNGAQARNAPTTDQAIAAARKETGEAMRTMLKSDVDSAEYKAAEAKWLEATKKIKELEGGNPYIDKTATPAPEAVTKSPAEIASGEATNKYNAAVDNQNAIAKQYGKNSPEYKAALAETDKARTSMGEAAAERDAYYAERANSNPELKKAEDAVSKAYDNYQKSLDANGRDSPSTDRAVREYHDAVDALNEARIKDDSAMAAAGKFENVDPAANAQFFTKDQINAELARQKAKQLAAGVAAGGAALASTNNAQAGESDPALKAARIMTGHAIFGYGR